MKILHLTVTKKWFDMIARGEKKEEYREIKQYWLTRLTYLNEDLPMWEKDFEVVRFKNGYLKKARTMDVEFKKLFIGKPNPKWIYPGFRNQNFFIIRLGEIISKNF
jgi:hypothetical protein